MAVVFSNNGAQVRPLDFDTFQNTRLEPNGADSDPSFFAISENFFEKMVDLYKRFSFEGCDSDQGKFDFVRSQITSFKGGPKREGGNSIHSRILIGGYSKGVTNLRMERGEIEKGCRPAFTIRWFHDTVKFYKYSMIWEMTFSFCDHQSFVIEDDIWTRKPFNHLLDGNSEKAQIYLEMKIHSFVMERIMNPRHSEHASFRDCQNQYWITHEFDEMRCYASPTPHMDSFYEKTAFTVNHQKIPLKSTVKFSGADERNFLWAKQKYSKDQYHKGILQKLKKYPEDSYPDYTSYFHGSSIAADQAKKMKWVQSKEKNTFLEAVRILEEKPAGEIIETARRFLWSELQFPNPYDEAVNPCREGTFWKWFLDRTAAKFQETDVLLGRLMATQSKFLDPQFNCFCFSVDEGESQFEKLNKSQIWDDASYKKAKEIARSYQEMRDKYCELIAKKERMLVIQSLQRKPFQFFSKALAGIGCIETSLKRCEAQQDKWHLKAGGLEKMNAFLVRIEEAKQDKIVMYQV